MRFPDARLLIFAKAPVPGNVKTRLIPVLGAQGAAHLHAELTERTVRVALESGCACVELWCAPHTQAEFFAALHKRHGVDLHAQCEGDLGARMAHAFESALQRGRYIIALGTDWCELTALSLHAACVALDDGCDAVVAPAEDGGYVLLGLRDFHPRVFENIAWGGDTVWGTTRARFIELGLQWRELPLAWDVDRPADWERMMQRKNILWKANALPPRTREE